MMPAPGESPYSLDFAQMIGGRRGVIDATTPGIALVIFDTFAPLGWAIGAALVAAACIAVLRRLRGQTLRQAGMGLIGLAFAAALAAFTGDAKNYFLPGILFSAGYALACLISIAARRPLLAYVAALLDRGYSHWRDHPPLRRAASVATAIWAVVFGLRACVQGYLYVHDSVDWLAPVRLAMGLPLFAVALAATLFILEGHAREEALDLDGMPQLDESNGSAPAS